MKIYFEYPENATHARTELISMGVPERAVHLDIHQAGGPIDGLKRAVGNRSAEATHGASVVVDDSDWLENQKVLEVARRYNGEIR